MTSPIDIAFARAFLKADGDDDDLITPMIAGATTICQDYCNRVFYADVEAQAADFTQALVDHTAALAARKMLIDGVDTNDPHRDETRRLISDHYGSVLAAIKGRINGIVLDDAINAAILMTLGHLYKNREDNLATGNNVVQLPVGAQRILQSKLWIGDLVANSVCEPHHHDHCGS